MLVVALATPAIGASFPDVPSNHWAYEAINELVAAGVIEGYPDGTYKGQRNLTRYEIAMIVSRVMDNMAEQRQELMDKVESMEKKDSGLTTEQAQDVTAIVKALMEKNMPEAPEPPTELTDQQADQVVNLIEALTFEYQAELKVLRSDYDSLRDDLGLLEDNLESVRERVTALEEATPPVTFGGSYSVTFNHKDVIDGEVIDTGSGFNHYYIEDAPLSAYDADGDLALDDDEFEAYVSDVAAIIETRIREMNGEIDSDPANNYEVVAEYYNHVFDDTLEEDEVTESTLVELAVAEFNYVLVGQPTEVGSYTGTIPGGEITAAEVESNTEWSTVSTSYTLADFRIQEDTADAVDALTMWDDGDADAMEFEEIAELTHTLNLNADINYAGFEGQVGVTLEKLDSTDEATFKSADLELENDELKMVYNEKNEVSYSDFAVSSEKFNAASFLYKPYGVNAFVGIDEVEVDDSVNPLTNDSEDDEELNVSWEDYDWADADEDDVYELYFNGDATSDTADYVVAGAQKTFVLDMADVKTTVAGRLSPDFEESADDEYEDLVVGAEATAKISGFDFAGDVAVSTDAVTDEFGYLFRVNASTQLVDAFTAGASYKNRGENFSPLYGSLSVFDDEDTGYNKYEAGLAQEKMSGYGVSVAHDGTAENALVSGLDLNFGYDVVDYDGYDENDTRLSAGATMAVMENLTVEGSFKQFTEPTGEETDYDGDTTKYSVGATFVPVENAEVSAAYKVMDPVEDVIPTEDDDGEEYKAVNENTIELKGSYDFTDYVGVTGSYTDVSGLSNYEDAEKTTTSVGVSLTDYPVITGLTASASVDYKMVTGKEFVDAEETANPDEDFNVLDATDTPGFEEYDATTTSMKAGLAYTLNEKTSLTYDLGYTTQEAKDEASDLYSGNYMTNAVGVDYTFTENASLTASYKLMQMDYDADDGADDWTAQEATAGVSISF
ncbi:MAG TPA: S-layer homology domain-containing protein [Halanaerobiales bacterium]|nr:S-layer homology domain-containing protein [Halanaerobiales bacterium]